MITAFFCWMMLFLLYLFSLDNQLLIRICLVIIIKKLTKDLFKMKK